jgi:hypothetical protein
MYPHPQIMFELARQRREELFTAAERSRAATPARDDEVVTRRALVRLLRHLRPPARIEIPRGHASRS